MNRKHIKKHAVAIIEIFFDMANYINFMMKYDEIDKNQIIKN
jgi:hypothetical protein